MIFDYMLTISASAIAAGILSLIQQILNKKKSREEEKEVKREVDRVVLTLQDEPKDVLTLMRRNVAELREYYTINKQQARNAFTAAVFVCFLGFVLFVAGVIISYVTSTNQNVVQYTTVSGAIVELISGLFFWLYSKAIKQINVFHDSLQKTQQFLTAIQLVESVSPANRDATYAYIIQSVIGNAIPIGLVNNVEDDKTS